MGRFKLSDVCCFDTETTGVPEKGMQWDVDFMRYPRPVSMAWAFGDKERHEIIRPQGWEIPEETVAIHGVTEEMAEKEGKPFKEVVGEFLDDVEACPLICAHNIYFDTSIIKAAIMALCPGLAEKAEHALYKGKRIDTMYKTIRFVGAKYRDGRPGKYPRLEELYAKLFDGGTFPAHNALEDVRALRKCLPPLVDMGIVNLEPKEYPEDAEAKKSAPGNTIEFHDPSPVLRPIGADVHVSGHDVKDLLAEDCF